MKNLSLLTLLVFLSTFSFGQSTSYSGWISCNDNICLNKLQYKYRFIENGDDNYELKVIWRNNFNQRIFFSFKLIVNGYSGSFDSGRTNVKANGESGWPGSGGYSHKSPIKPIVKVSKVRFEKDDWSAPYWDCDINTGEYFEKVKNTANSSGSFPKSNSSSTPLPNQNNNTPSSSSSYGVDTEKLKREYQQEEALRRRNEETQERIRRQQEERKKLEEEERKAYEDIIATGFEIGNRIMENWERNSRARDEAKRKEEARRIQAEKEKREEEARRRAEERRKNKLRDEFMEKLSEDEAKNKVFEKWARQYFFFARNRDNHDISFSNIFVAYPNIDDKIFIIDIKKRYPLYHGSKRYWLYGPFPSKTEANKAKEALIKKSLKNYWNLERDHHYNPEEKPPTVRDGARANHFWGITKTDNPKTNATYNNYIDNDKFFWGVEKGAEFSMNSKAKVIQQSTQTVPPKQLNRNESDYHPSAGEIMDSPPIYQLIGSTSFRKEASSKAGIILRFRVGNEVVLIEETNRHWYKVKFKGQFGYVKISMLKKK